MPDAVMTTGLTVLYAEDDTNDAFFMRHAFGKLSEAVTLQIVSNGRDVLHYLNCEGEYGDRSRYPVPSLLLLDVKMPVLSGLEVLAEVRSHPEFAAMPVLMFSSSAQESDVAHSRRLRANAYFVKPANATQLHLVMQEVLKVIAAGLPAYGLFPIKENLLGEKDRKETSGGERNPRLE